MEELPAFLLFQGTFYALVYRGYTTPTGTSSLPLQQRRPSEATRIAGVRQIRKDGNLNASHNLPNVGVQCRHCSAQSRVDRQRQGLKVTPWRLVNSLFILSAGISKAICAYQGLSTVPNTLDWVLGVIWALTAYWSGFVESEYPTALPWFFQTELELPIALARMAIAMFVTFSVICFSLTFVIFLMQRILMSTRRDILIVLATIGLPCVSYGVYRFRFRGKARPKLPSMISRSVATFISLFFYRQAGTNAGSQGLIFLWLPPFVAILLSLGEIFDISADLSTFQACLQISAAFGASAVLSSGVVLWMASMLSLGIRLRVRMFPA